VRSVEGSEGRWEGGRASYLLGSAYRTISCHMTYHMIIPIISIENKFGLLAIWLDGFRGVTIPRTHGSWFDPATCHFYVRMSP
jgi:hypothetical protein